MRRHWKLAIAAIFAFVFCTTSSNAAADRTVAVGDVHGSIDGLATILLETGLVDEKLDWAGGDATLVQLGDMLDRGVRLREVLDLLMSLQQQAPADGGRVVVLLGNHEAMNLLGITRDVNRDAYAEFVDSNSEGRRKQAWQRYQDFWRRRATELGVDVNLSDEAKAQWMEIHPPGFFEYAEALGPEGAYGKWLRTLSAAAVIADTLFVHGGWGPLLDGQTVDEVNAKVAQEISEFDRERAWMVAEGLALPWFSAHELTREAQREIDAVAALPRDEVPAERLQRAIRLGFRWDGWYLLDPGGPLWFRGTARWSEEEHAAEMTALLDHLGVARQVVGHTPQSSQRIQSRFNGRVYLIDTGMLKEVYGGLPSALEITDHSVVAVYQGERQVLDARAIHEPAAAAAVPSDE